MVITELRKQDKNWIRFIQNYPRVLSLEPQTFSLNREVCSVLGQGLCIWFFLAWITYFSKLSASLWTNFMLTDLASVSVVNLFPLSSKSTLHCLLYEKEEGPCKYFSGMMLCVSMEGHGRRKGFAVLVVVCSLLQIPVCGLSTARLLQHATADSTQWPAASSCTSPSNVTINSKVWCLSVDGFRDTPEGRFPVRSTGKASNEPWLHAFPPSLFLPWVLYLSPRGSGCFLHLLVLYTLELFILLNS